MTEIRCVKCRRLLMKSDHVKGEIKCPKCGYVNYVNITFWTCMGKPLSETPTEILRNWMDSSQDEAWRPLDDLRDLRNAVFNELAKRN